MEKINSENTEERLSYIINEMTDLTDHTSSIENITSQIHDVILQVAEPCKKKIQLSVIMHMLYVCVLCASCGSSQCSVLYA